jgi:hypothetical protein
MNIIYENLIASVRDNLAPYHYSEPPETLPFIEENVVIATPRRKLVRYVCVIMIIPDNCRTPEQATKLFEASRRALTKRYARFPWWKELGTYLVWICDTSLFEAMQSKMTYLKDKTGLHMNVMLGMILVDRQNLVSSSESTWGLYYSGKHFGAISATVNEWCKRSRGEQNSSSR